MCAECFSKANTSCCKNLESDTIGFKCPLDLGYRKVDLESVTSLIPKVHYSEGSLFGLGLGFSVRIAYVIAIV